MPRKKKDEVIEATIYEKKKREKATDIVEPDVTSSRKSSTTKEKTGEMVEWKDGKEKSESKPYFFPRLIAYIIDILIVSVVVSGITILLPENENYNKYMKEYEKVQTELINKDITYQEFVDQSREIVYDIDYSNVLSMIIEVVAIILYFIIFLFYNKGQTLGKKLMKLRVVNARGENLTINQIALRSLLVNSILVNILMIGSVLFVGRKYYFYASLGLQYLAMAIEFVILLMILFRKDGRGLHDVVAGTQVIQEN